MIVEAEQSVQGRAAFRENEIDDTVPLRKIAMGLRDSLALVTSEGAVDPGRSVLRSQFGARLKRVSSSNAFASFRSRVSKPSANQP
jgi:hypothetical protein